MTARCASGAWAWALPSDAASCRRARVFAVPRVGFTRVCATACGWVWGAEWGAWADWYRSQPLCPPGRDEGRRDGQD